MVKKKLYIAKDKDRCLNAFTTEPEMNYDGDYNIDEDDDVGPVDISLFEDEFKKHANIEPGECYEVYVGIEFDKVTKIKDVDGEPIHAEVSLG